ncbi:MAG: hypothetical protein C5B51_16630 [Terriglobia bacterium]|nr:MAG: hypothetical protein C5B51_16630 [Terriglobia bacterium]
MNPISGPIPIFILHWNRPEECAQTVRALMAQPLPLAVHVVDNASEPSALQELKQRIPSQVNIVPMQDNLGWGRAFNRVLRNWLDEGQGDFCFISSHDAMPDKDSLVMLIQSMQDDPKIGIACPEYGRAEVPKFSRLRYVRITRVEPRPAGAVEAVDLPNGTLMLFRRQCLQEIGLFDERYFAYGDEHEIGLRARRHNWKVAIVWGSIVLNPGTWTLSGVRSYLFTRNSLLLVRTYAGWWAAAIRLFLMVPNTLRMLLSPPNKDYAFSFRSRVLGMCDYVRNHYGPPPR